MDPVQVAESAKPVGEVLVSLAQIIGTQITIMFLIDRAARLIERAMTRKEETTATTQRVDLYGPRPIRLTQVVDASSAEAPSTRPQEGSTGSSSPSAS